MQKSRHQIAIALFIVIMTLSATLAAAPAGKSPSTQASPQSVSELIINQQPTADGVDVSFSLPKTGTTPQVQPHQQNRQGSAAPSPQPQNFIIYIFRINTKNLEFEKKTTSGWAPVSGTETLVEYAHIPGQAWAGFLTITSNQKANLKVNGASKVGVIAFPQEKTSRLSIDPGLLAVALAGVGKDVKTLKNIAFEKTNINDRLTKAADTVFDSALNNVDLSSLGKIVSRPQPYFPQHEVLTAYVVYKNGETIPLYATSYGFTEPDCSKSIRITIKEQERSQGAYTYVLKEFDLKKDGEMKPDVRNACVFKVQITTGTKSLEKITEKYQVTFKRVFDTEIDYTKNNRGVRIFYHSQDQNGRDNSNKIKQYYDKLKERMTEPTPVTNVYLFTNAREQYDLTGVPVSGGRDDIALNGMQMQGCPAIGAIVLDHQFENNYLPLWLFEGAGVYHALDASTYSIQPPYKLSFAIKGRLDASGTKLTDLNQVLEASELSKELEPFYQVAAVDGGEAFLDYADGRFGSQKVDDFLKTMKEIGANNQITPIQIKQIMQKSFGLTYETYRNDWNTALKQLSNALGNIQVRQPPTTGQPPTVDQMLQQIDATNCKQVDKTWIDPAQAEIKQIQTQINSKTKCNRYKNRLTQMENLARKSPNAALMRAYGVFDAAKKDKCIAASKLQ